MKRPLSHGFTLTEVLIAMLVLSVGIVGIAAMELTLLRLARQTSYHESALRLGNDMADFLRLQQRSSVGNTRALANLDYQAGHALPPVAGHCFNAPCSTAEFTSNELVTWLARLQQELPSARLRICRDSQPWNAASAAYVWPCTATAGSATADPLVFKLGWREPGRDARTSNGEDAPRVVLQLYGEAS